MSKQPLLAPQASILHAVIDDAGVEPVLAVARRPGMSAVYRLTVYHHDGRAQDSVATLLFRPIDGARLEMVYRTALRGRQLIHPIPAPRYEAFVAALQGARFDTLPDQPDLPPYGVDLWLLERAAGSFTRGLILAPALADDVYAVIVAAVQTHLPEALREVR